MGVRGRKSAASRAVVAIVGNPGPTQSTPPVYLTPEQDEVWRVVVSSRGGDLITKESFPLLVEYCRATVAANQIAAQIDEFLPEWAKDDEGLKRWDKLLAMQDRQAKLVAQLGAKLRLTPSSRVQAISAGRNAAKGEMKRPWDVGDE